MASQVPRDRRSPVLLGGGIGAGKTSVGERFGEAGYLVIVADELGHDVLAEGRPAVVEVAQRWPSAVSGGVVDRHALARIVFSDPEALRELEAITHPRIADAIDRRIEAAGSTPVVVEIPVLGVVSGVDAVRIAVVADDEVRVARAVARGGDRDDVLARMRSQIDQAEWRAWADVVIDNSGAWAETERLVDAVIADLADA